MKKLTKIKLVNWHLFSNQTIDIQGNTLISGENGSGKSTLLDAIQYLLVGGRGGVKFNVAATDDAKRTLDGYVRGRIGAENKEYIRTGDVITHVALEFYDEKEKTFNIIGAIIDAPRNTSMRERLYILENVAVHDEMFLEGNMPRDYKSMKEYFRAQDIDLAPFDTQRKYRDALSKFFGMDARKYAQLLPKALAFRSIDLQTFVFEFLLDDNPIDIQSLKNNVSQLKRVEAQIKSDREKLEKLDSIIDVGTNITELKEQVQINEIIDNLNWVEQRENFLKSSEEALSKLDTRLNTLRTAKADLDTVIEENDQNILNLEKAKDNNDLSKTLTEYQENLDRKNKEYTYQEEVLRQVNNDLLEEVAFLKHITKVIPDQAMNGFIKYFEQNQNNLSSHELINHLNLVAGSVSAYEKAFHTERQNIERNKTEISTNLRNAQYRLNNLRKNIKTYPKYVTDLIESINRELTYKFNKEINVRPLADLIEVNDENWRNALEGYLNTQRFDIIVEPEYFNDALDVYERVKGELRIYGVGLVNTAKLQAYNETKDGSLASKVTTEHPYARLYVNMLLNGIYCVYDVQDLKNFSRSITPTGMTYANHTARQINPRVYEVPFIGDNATASQIKIAEAEVKELEELMKQSYSDTDTNETVARLLSRSHALRLVQQNNLRFIEIIRDTRKEIATLEHQLQSLSMDASLQKIEDQLDQERNRRRQLRLDQEKIISETANAREERQRTLNAIDDVKEKLEDILQKQKQFSLTHGAVLSIAQTQYQALKQKTKYDYNTITQDIQRSNVLINNQLNRMQNDITNQMRAFVHQYSFNVEPNFENLITFEAEANIIKNNNLIKYEQQATELRKASEIGFKEEFVNKLRASIETAQQQIEELNFALEGKKFGSDHYQLLCLPSEDPEYKMYYEIIMSSTAHERQTLFTEGLSKKNERILMELFEKISSDNPEYDRLAYEFLDYRNYMSYDIKIENDNGNLSYFSKVSREKSGGETQVPFYIVIAASFQQLLSRNKRIDSGCVVLFDEAFNNMDESRIEAMMKFYNSLSIQLLISIPPQRVSNIIPYVNTSLIIVKHNDYAIVESFKDDRIVQ
ncbi:MAG: ATP-binding protein [Acholeplasmataceae bacterium]